MIFLLTNFLKFSTTIESKELLMGSSGLVVTKKMKAAKLASHTKKNKEKSFFMDYPSGQVKLMVA